MKRERFYVRYYNGGIIDDRNYYDYSERKVWGLRLGHDDQTGTNVKYFDDHTFSEISRWNDAGRWGRGELSRFVGMERTAADGGGTGKGDAVGNVMTAVRGWVGRVGFSDATPKALSWASIPSKTESSEVSRYSDTEAEDNALFAIVDSGPRRLPNGEKPLLTEKRAFLIPVPKRALDEREEVLALFVPKLPRCSRLVANEYARR